MVTKESIISRQMTYDYTTIKGLCAITGLDSGMLPYAVLKEVIDNALDAVEGIRSPLVTVTIDDDRILVKDNGEGIDKRYIKQIFDYRVNTSSKHFIKRVSRGAFGVGLKLVPAIVHTLARNADNPNRIEPVEVEVEVEGRSNGDNGNSSSGNNNNGYGKQYFRLRSRDYELVITDVRGDVAEGVLCDMTIRDTQEKMQGTEVEVRFHRPIINKTSARSYIISYMIANPWIGFIYNGIFYKPVSKFNLRKKSSIHYYTMEEFMESFRYHKANYPDMKLRSFIIKITGVNIKDKEEGAQNLQSISDHEMREVYNNLITTLPKPTSILLGRKRVLERVKEIFGKDYKKVKYDHGTIGYSVWEAYCIYYDRPVSGKDLIFGLNNSIALTNPLYRYLLIEKDKKVGVNDVLRASGLITVEELRNFVIFMHLLSPYALYGGYAKAEVQLSPGDLTVAHNLLKRVTAWYRSYKGRALRRIDSDKLLEEVVRLVKEYNSKGIAPTVRHLFYRIGSSGTGIIPFNEKGYRAVIAAAKDARLRNLIPLDSIADRSRYYIDCAPEYDDVDEHFIYDILSKNLHRLGLNPWIGIKKYIEIWVEKDSMMDFIKPIAEKYNLVVLTCRGYPSISALYNRFKTILSYGCKENTILYLGDHDPSGLDIERDIRERLEEFISLYRRQYGGNMHIRYPYLSMLEGRRITVKRVAVTEKQAVELNLPTCPLKRSDRRSVKYGAKYDKAWELEAIDPEIFYKILEESIVAEISDKERWQSILDMNKRLRESFENRIKDIAKTFKDMDGL